MVAKNTQKMISVSPAALYSFLINILFRKREKSFENIGDPFHWDTVVFGECSNACFPPRRAAHLTELGMK